MNKHPSSEKPPVRRILARVLAEELESVLGGDLNKEVKSVSCGVNCDQLVDDCLKLPDDSFNE